MRNVLTLRGEAQEHEATLNIASLPMRDASGLPWGTAWRCESVGNMGSSGDQIGTH